MELQQAEVVLSGWQVLGSPSPCLPAGNPTPMLGAMDPKPESASGRVSAVPAAGAEAASFGARTVCILVAQMLYGAEAEQSVLGAAALLH